MKKKKLLEDIKELLSALYQDTQMALCGDWDKSDGGFEAQQELIERFCDEYNIEIEEYERKA